MPAPSLIPKRDPDDKVKDRIDMRLYNTIAIYDVYHVARSGEAARQALLEGIASGDIKPMEVTATESKMANSIRASWVDQPPFIASDITDEEFESLKGITTSRAFERFYQRR